MKPLVDKELPIKFGAKTVLNVVKIWTLIENL